MPGAVWRVLQSVSDYVSSRTPVSAAPRGDFRHAITPWSAGRSSQRRFEVETPSGVLGIQRHPAFAEDLPCHSRLLSRVHQPCEIWSHKSFTPSSPAQRST